MRPTTIRDARELDLLPSVTTVLRVLEKPALTAWKIEQAVLAVMTTPRREGEEDDDFVNRVINVEAQQDQERDAAAKRGRDGHQALEDLLQGRDIDEDLKPWVYPAYEHIKSTCGMVRHTEHCLTGADYAGRTDSIWFAGFGTWHILDYKFTKKLPDPKKGAWPEHRLQLSAYGRAWLDMGNEPARLMVGNVYVSTVDPGKFVVCETSDWFETYERGFRPVLEYWKWLNNFGV